MTGYRQAEFSSVGLVKKLGFVFGSSEDKAGTCTCATCGEVTTGAGKEAKRRTTGW